MTERWEEIADFPDYAVSDQGVIANMRSGMPRRTSINQQGIVKITLYKNHKEIHTKSVAVFVAEAFVEGKTPLFNTPIHLDGDRENCAASNLMWRPRWFAVQYHRQFFEPAFHNANVPIEDVDTGRQYQSFKEACIEHGLYHGDVYRSVTENVGTQITNQYFQLVEPEGQMG